MTKQDTAGQSCCSAGSDQGGAQTSADSTSLTARSIAARSAKRFPGISSARSAATFCCRIHVVGTEAVGIAWESLGSRSSLTPVLHGL